MSDHFIDLAREGTKACIDEIMIHLNEDMTLVESRFIDFALSHVDNPEGVSIIRHYLFNGNQIQRNYCALYFGRLHEYYLLREAYEKGLIDDKQAFCR